MPPPSDARWGAVTRWALAGKRGLACGILLGVACLQATHAPAAAAGQGSIPLTIKAVGGAQSSAPVFTGIPFPPGACADVNQIELIANSQPVARQVRVLASYPDGSVRVALLGFRTTLAAGQSTTATVRYGFAAGLALSPAMAWTRNLGVLALCPPQWYGESGVFGTRFLAAADNTLFPAFETALRAHYTGESDPPSDTNPDNRNFYDHVHALYVTLLRSSGPDSTPSRIWNEVSQYRENEILHSGTYRGQYQAGSITGHGLPIPVNVVRRMYPQGLLDDYYFSGDDRSLAVAQEIGEAFIVDAYQQGATFTYTERTPGFELIGLCALYEATLDPRYLDAARNIATITLNHQDAMALKYPNQGGISGQTGGFIQDLNGRWFDPDESTVSGAGSPFMTTLLCEGLIQLYWLTGDARTRTGIVRACDWLADAAFAAANDPRNVDAHDSFWYIAVDPANNGTTPSLNPMFLQMLGFAHQVTGDPKYLTLAQRILAVNDWGNTIKEFNQDLRSSGQGLYLLQNAAGSLALTQPPTAGPTLPNPPTNLTAAAASMSQINLTWSDNAGDENGFRIERSPDGSTFTEIAILGANATTYSDPGLTAATTYSYRVRAYNGVGSSAASAVASATTSVAPPPPGTSLSDTFNDNVRDPKWSFGTLTGAVTAGPGAWDSGIPVQEQGGRLEISPRSRTTGIRFNGYLSTAAWNVSTLAASVEVVQATKGTADTAFAIGVDHQNFYLIEVESGRLYFASVVAGVRNQPSIDYNGTTHRFWRIRHDGPTDTIRFETSRDGTAWTTQRTVPRQLPLTAMRIELGAGTWESVNSPGKAIFDNFKLQ